MPKQFAFYGANTVSAREEESGRRGHHLQVERGCTEAALIKYATHCTVVFQQVRGSIHQRAEAAFVSARLP